MADKRIGLREVAARKAGKTPPLLDRYDDLVASLRTVEEAKHAKKIDQLNASRLPLIQILTFLHSDPHIMGATRSLGTLLSALHDFSQGAKPGLLFDRSAPSGAPNHLVEAVRRAQIVLAFECLIKSGMEKCSAAEWIADKLKALEVMQRNNTIDAKTIVRLAL
ncbi:MAG: hypothetical protein ACLPX7_00965 [Xanthobacteraceae bacterium]